MSDYTVPASEAWRFQLPDQCPHCPEGVTICRDQLDGHIAEAHADLPPCTARISNAGTSDQTVRCRFRVGHRDDSGDYHAGPYGERMGRLRWGDHAMGAVPHADAEGGAEEQQVSELDQPSDDTGRRCPRCDCPDGHTQCDHCKVCPHVDGPAQPSVEAEDEPKLYFDGPLEEFTLKPPDRTIRIIGEDGRTPLVTIHANGTLEYGPGYEPADAARRFWDALRHYMPARCPNCGHVGLEAL